MLKIAIVEDDDSDFGNLDSVLKRYQEEEKIQFGITRFPNGKTFLENLDDSFDIVFLDIDLKDSNGIDLAKALRNVDRKVSIIFVTNLAQFAINGYEVEALDFVVKPVKYYDFFFKIQKAIDKAMTNKDMPIRISSGKELVTLRQDEIAYVEVMHHSLVIHTVTKNIKSYGTLKEIEEKVNPALFARCNNCYLVNLSHVSSVSGYTIRIGDEELLISHPKKKEFMKALNLYLSGARK